LVRVVANADPESRLTGSAGDVSDLEALLGELLLHLAAVLLGRQPIG
jgi:hypothetical protein